MLAPLWVNCSARWHVSSWSVGTSHMPGEDSNYMGEGKIITIPATRISTNISAYCVLISELPRKTQQSSTGWTMLWLTWRRDSKVSSNRVQVHSQQAPWSRFPQQLMQRGLFIGALFATRQKDASPSPLESEILIVEGMCEDHWCTCLCNKGRLI